MAKPTKPTPTPTPAPTPTTANQMELHVYLHGDSPDVRIDEVLRLLNLLVIKGDQIMATLDETLAKVTEEDTKQDSLIALFTGMKQQLADALAGANLSPAMQAKVDAVFNQAVASVAKVDAAISANTPAAPPA